MNSSNVTVPSPFWSVTANWCAMNSWSLDESPERIFRSCRSAVISACDASVMRGK